MKQLTSAAAGVVALLLMLSFNLNAGATDTSLLLQRPSQVRRSKKSIRPNYSQFLHRTHLNNGKTGCDSCHKFPTDNWKAVRAGDAAFPDVAEFPEHGTCLNCHRQQFFARQRPAPAICSNCHVNVTPRDTARFVFPSLGDVTDGGKSRKNNVAEFKIEFPHDKHEDQECVVCHKTEAPEEGAKLKTRSHTICFSCHNVESEVSPAPSACNKCHGFVSKVRDHSWIGSVQGAVATWSNHRVIVTRKYRMLITDQVATAPCTDPIQVRATLMVHGT